MMISIIDGASLARALQTLADCPLGHLLALRRDQLGGDITGLAHFVVVQPLDTLAEVERGLGFSPLQNLVDGSRHPDPDFTPSWEWIEDHSHTWEMAFIFSDDGFCHALFVPQQQGVPPQLTELCRAFVLA